MEPSLSLACFLYKYKYLQADQVLQEQLPFLQTLLNFITTKFLKQELYDELSVCMNNVAPVDSLWQKI